MDEYYKIAANTVLAGFHGYTLPQELIHDIESGCFLGAILFKRNVESHNQVHELLTEIKERSPKNSYPVLSVDQEGGRVIRVREPLNVLPPAETFGKIDNEQLTYDAGLLTGKELSALGFTLNFAPVMDVNTNPESPVIGDRSYGEDVNTVIKHSMAFAGGLVDGGVFPCAKHFPGHGDAAVDSHKGLPFVSHNIKRLEEIELAPFKHWAQNSAWPIMTAHVIYPALDKTKPATMSSKILTDLLRSEFNFNGVIFSDDLEMGAIANETGEVSSALLSLEAGADALLVCSNLDLRNEIIESIAYKAKTNPTFYNRLKASANRVANLSTLKDLNVPFSFIGSDTHHQQKDNLLKQINR